MSPGQGTKRGKNVPSGVLEHAGGRISGQKRARRNAGAVPMPVPMPMPVPERLFGGPLVTFLGGAGGHSFDAGFGVGVGGEEFLDGRGPGAGAVGDGLEFLEGHGHAPGVLAAGLEEFVTVVVGLALLLLGVLGVHDGVADGAELGVRKDGGRLARGGKAFEGGAGQERGAHFLLRMLHGDMADFVADHAQQFVVRHHVHDAGIDPDAAVCAGESVHLVLLVHLEVQRNAVHGSQPFRQVPQTLRVGVALGQDLALGVELGDVLVDIGLDLLVGDGQGLRGDEAALEGALRIEGFGAGDEQERAGCEGE